MASSWSELCSAAQSRPLSVLLSDLYGMGSTLVSSYILCAVVTGAAFVRWRKKSAEEKSVEWPAYGWFTALSCLGSIAGAISFGARIGQLHGVYASRKIELFGTSTPGEFQEMNRLRAAELHYCAVHFATVPFEAGFMIIAKLLVLHRMHKFAVINSLRERAWRLASRVFLAVFIVGIAIGVVANITSAFYYSQAANLNSKASDAWAGNASADGNLLLHSAVSTMSQAGRIASVQRLSEIVMLLLTVSAFLLVGFYSLRIIASALRALVSAEKKLCEAISESDKSVEKTRGGSLQDHRKIVELQTQQHKSIELVIQAGNQGRKLRQKVTLTVLWIFFSVLLLTLFMVTYGVALSSQNFDDNCSPDHCNPCKNVYAHMIFWMLYTPWSQQAVMLVASPVTLLIALWGMTNVTEIESMSRPLAKLRQRWRQLQG